MDLASDALFEVVPEGLAVCHPDTGEVLDVNERFCTLTGRRAGALVGTTIGELGVSEPPLSPGRTHTADQERFEWLITDGEGSPMSLDVTCRTVETDEGARVLLSARQTRASANERDLEAYRRRLDGAMLAGGLAWWEMDVDSGQIIFDENKTDLLGYPADRFVHYDDFVTLVHPEDTESVMQAMRDHLEGRLDRYDTQYRIEAATGEDRWFHDVGGVTERTDDGRPATVTGIVIDITDRKGLEQRLQEQNDQLALLNRLVRHDIRNDMAVALGWLEAIEDTLPASVRADIARVQRACDHTVELTELSRDLLAVIVEHDGALDPIPVGLREVIAAELEKARRLYDRATITVDGEIPDVTVSANAMLSSVVANLLNNAVQHNDADHPEVSVSVEREAGTVVVRVADNGPGIPEERRTTVFGRGEKGLDSTGTGMGLYLVDSLVDAYNGRVWIEDRADTSP